jgi:hypothetical protein
VHRDQEANGAPVALGSAVGAKEFLPIASLANEAQCVAHAGGTADAAPRAGPWLRPGLISRPKSRSRNAAVRGAGENERKSA